MAVGACTTCSASYEDCPVSDPDAGWAVDANGNCDGLCCEDCWHDFRGDE